ncbi:MAG: hypothetical protein HZA90_27970 [Verrucomicrobia bacterium]|nr:hypothetical protein [Verrucomicrobiota bacterium]
MRTRNHYGLGNCYSGIQHAPCGADRETGAERERTVLRQARGGGAVLQLARAAKVFRLSGTCAGTANNSHLIPHSQEGCMYRCTATSIEGFVQQLAVAYVTHGYWFYVTGWIPEDKDPRKTDEKLVRQYGLNVSKWTRCRRKKAGLASVQYLRYERFFVLVATHGQHALFVNEPYFQDLRENPLEFAGYSIGCRRGWDGNHHASVRLSRGRWQTLRNSFAWLALRPDVEDVAAAFRTIPAAPYAPVRRQLLQLLGQVNRRRKAANLEMVPVSALRLRRSPVAPFREHESALAT